ncbi:lysostaphin resistance A-like protein [Porcipelethomonas sp.]|uniref:CPBP family intramembrane glutamic endopeptidase n=1 Tax=Porcipelethomonas sp. TaxID=2981675 RepID=UPI003EF92B80
MEYFDNESEAEQFEQDARYHVYNKQFVKPIDPHNPFDNPTENPDYNDDYGKLVPQISIEGCELPFMPGDEEKKKIRHFYNVAGGGILIHIASAYVIANVLYFIVMAVIMSINGISFSELFSGGADKISDMINNSSISSGITLISYLTANLLAFYAGCRFADIKTKSLFKTTDFSLANIIQYIVIGLFIQRLAALAITILYQLLPGTDLIGNSQVVTYTSFKAMAISVCYTCIIAPITEELFYRGFVMKTLSRVSQRFGILISAFFFGISHGNAAQFVLAFSLGIFMGYIDVKHNSVIPSMFVHFFVNSFATLSGVIDNYAGEESLITALMGFAAVVLFIAGIAAFIIFCRKNTFPKSSIHQKFRCGKIAFTSPAIIISAVIYIIAFISITF